MLVMREDIFSNSRWPLQVATAARTPARRMGCKEGLAIAFIQEFNVPFVFSHCGEMKQLELVEGVLDQRNVRRCTVCNRCWHRNLNAARDIRLVASFASIAFPNQIVCIPHFPAMAPGDGKQDKGAADQRDAWARCAVIPVGY